MLASGQSQAQVRAVEQAKEDRVKEINVTLNTPGGLPSSERQALLNEKAKLQGNVTDTTTAQQTQEIVNRRDFERETAKENALAALVAAGDKALSKLSQAELIQLSTPGTMASGMLEAYSKQYYQTPLEQKTAAAAGVSTIQQRDVLMEQVKRDLIQGQPVVLGYESALTPKALDVAIRDDSLTATIQSAVLNPNTVFIAPGGEKYYGDAAASKMIQLSKTSGGRAYVEKYLEKGKLSSAGLEMMLERDVLRGVSGEVTKPAATVSYGGKEYKFETVEAAERFAQGREFVSQQQTAISKKESEQQIDKASVG
jgi:hypothetical protein